MNVKGHGHIGTPEDAGFEHKDLGAGGVIAFFVGLIVFVIVANVIIRGLYAGMDAYARKHRGEISPLVAMPQGDMRGVSPLAPLGFPEPRLETNERMEINDFRLKEDQALRSYGWVDEKAGVVHIPIDRAMDLIAQRGLPVAPGANGAKSGK